MKKILLSILFAIAFILISVQLVSADTNPGVSASAPAVNSTQATAPSNPCATLDSSSNCYTPLAPIIDPRDGKNISTESFPSYLDAIYRIGIGLCFALGVIMFTWAGIEYILSESMGTKSDAKKRMQAALTGLAIALVSYILLNTINPDLLTLKTLQVNVVTPPTTK